MSTGIRKRKTPGTRYCSALGCFNNRLRNQEMPFFRFPADPERCSLWVRNCSRLDLSSKDVLSLHNSFQLCAEHFEETQFVEPTTKKRLLSNAVPTIFCLNAAEASNSSVLDASCEEWENDAKSACSSECSSTGSLEVVHIKVEPKDDNMPEIHSEESSSDVRIKSEDDSPLPPEDRESVVEVKVEPPFQCGPMVESGYIVPDHLEDMLSATSEDTTLKAVGLPTHTLSGNGSVSDSSEIQPVLLMWAQPAETDIGNEGTCEMTNKQRNRRKQVLLPKEDPEDEMENISEPSAKEERSAKSKTPFYKCKDCLKTFLAERSFRRHRKIHNIRKKTKCAICDVCFKTMDELNDHAHSHMKQKPFLCVVCKKSFSNRENVIRHVTTHAGIRPYKCSKCDLRFKSSSFTISHERGVHGVGSKSYQCSTCNMEFDYFETFKLHSHVHKHEHSRPYKCCYCASSFVSFKTLSLHTRNSHSNCKVHKCSDCSEEFPMSYLLIRHLYCGGGRCNVCQKKFDQGCALTKHMKSHVQNVKSYACKICKVTFSSRTTAHRHAKIEHPAEVDFVKNAKYLIDYITT